MVRFLGYAVLRSLYVLLALGAIWGSAEPPTVCREDQLTGTATCCTIGLRHKPVVGKGRMGG